MEVDLEAEPHPVMVARRVVRGALAVASVPEPVCEDAVLVTGELVANAALHGGGPGLLRLRVLDDGVLRIEVTDSGPGLPHRRPASPGRPGGHGLHVVHLLSRSWGTSAVPGGKTVWAEIPGAASGSPWPTDGTADRAEDGGGPGGGAAGRP